MASRSSRVDRIGNGTGNGRGVSTSSSSPLSTWDRLTALSLYSRSQAAAKAGLSFGNNRDLYLALGYDREITNQKYRDRYKRGGVARTIIRHYPERTWSGGFELVEDPAPDITTPFEEAFSALYNRLSLSSYLLRADIVARQGQYGVIVLGLPGESFKQEIPRGTSQGQLEYIRILYEDAATIPSDATVKNTSDPRYGKPLYYRCTIDRDQVDVHWSRVLHIVESPLDNDLYHDPALEACWNALDDLDKVQGAGAEATFRRMGTPAALEMDPEMDLDSTEEDLLTDELNELHHGMRPFARLIGTKPHWPTGNVPNFDPNQKACFRYLSSITRIPLRIFTGSERGEQASTQDRENEREVVDVRRSTFGTSVIRQLTDRLIEYGYLPTPVDYYVQWPQWVRINETEKATIVSNLALANERQKKATGEILVSSDEIRRDWLDYESLKESNIETGDETDQDNDNSENLDGDDDITSARHHHIQVIHGLANGDDLSTNPDLSNIHRIADEFLEPTARVYTRYWSSLSSNLENDSDLSALVDGGSPAAVVNHVEEIVNSTITRFTNTLTDHIITIHDAGARATLSSARDEGSLFTGESRRHDAPTTAQDLSFEMDFDAANPRAQQWAADYSSSQVTEVSAETIAGLRAIIEQGYAQGLPPRVLRRQIIQYVGLRSDQIAAVFNLREEILTSRPGTIIERFPPRVGVRSGAGYTIKVPREVTEQFLANALVRYRRQQHFYRGLLIARTEVLRSSNRGQQELWLQARDNRLIPPGTERYWIATVPDDGRTRDLHLDIHGLRAPLDQPFIAPDGRSLEPGQEPNCRCGQGLARTN